MLIFFIVLFTSASNVVKYCTTPKDSEKKLLRIQFRKAALNLKSNVEFDIIRLIV